MRKIIVALTVSATILALSACSSKDVGDNEIIATTKAGNITKTDLYEEMKDSIGLKVLENLLFKKAIENEFEITAKELQEAIDHQKEAFGDSFDLYLSQNNYTESFFENQVEFQLLQQKLVESLDEVTDEQIAAEYEKMIKEIHARHILLDDEKTAEEVIAKLKDGVDFAQLAVEYSIEPVAQQTDGDLGWFGLGKMVQPFEDAAFSLSKNEISEPVKTSFGYHVIEVLDTRVVELDETFEELQPTIEENIKKKLFGEKLITLMKNVDIDIKDESLKAVMDDLFPEE